MVSMTKQKKTQISKAINHHSALPLKQEIKLNHIHTRQITNQKIRLNDLLTLQTISLIIKSRDQITFLTLLLTLILVESIRKRMLDIGYNNIKNIKVSRKFKIIYGVMEKKYQQFQHLNPPCVSSLFLIVTKYLVLRMTIYSLRISS